MEIRFDKKRALVTGAGKGIGRALAKALLECGAETYALSRTQSDLDSLKQECPSIHTVCVDLADWDAARKAVQDLGVIDLLVNNAAVFIPSTFLDRKKEDLDITLDVNLKAVFNVSQIRVNAVNPTVVETDHVKAVIYDPESPLAEELRKWRARTPLKKFAQEKDVVHPVLYLLSDKSDMINGVTLIVDGGFTIC